MVTGAEWAQTQARRASQAAEFAAVVAPMFDALATAGPDPEPDTPTAEAIEAAIREDTTP